MNNTQEQLSNPKKFQFLLFILLISVVLKGQTDQQLHIPGVLTTSPIFIEHKLGSGTGFVVADTSSKNVYFISAKHVLLRDNDLLDDTILLTAYPRDPSVGQKNNFTIDIKAANKLGPKFIEDSGDVVAIRIGFLEPLNGDAYIIKYNQLVQKMGNTSSISTIPVYIFGSYDDVHIGDDIYIFGYPVSIGLRQQDQFDYSRPLLRKGAVAGKYVKLKTIVLDCPVYKGNSGGPVIRRVPFGQYYKYDLIGIVIQLIPYFEIWENRRDKITNYETSNSGYSVAISSDQILDLIGTMN